MIEFFVHFFLQTKIFFHNEKNEHLQNLSNFNLNFFYQLITGYQVKIKKRFNFYD